MTGYKCYWTLNNSRFSPSPLEGLTLDLEDLSFAAVYAKYCMTFLVFSVLPAPDSPLFVFLEKGKKIELWQNMH